MVSGLAFFIAAAVVDDDDDGWLAPDDFLSEVGFTASAVVPSAFSSAAVSRVSLCRGWSDDDSAAEPGGVVPVAPAAEFDGVVPADPVVPDVPDVEPDDVVPAVELAEPVEDVVDVSDAGAAQATPGDSEIADPMPNATANAPIRPT